MGIAGFFLWLKQHYSQCIESIPQTVVEAAQQHKASPDDTAPQYRYDNLYIDMNGLLHPCCHDTSPLPEPKNEEEMLSRLYDQLDLLVKVVRPRKCLVLCVDGVAPRSKLNQQRSRRFHGVEEREEGHRVAEACADAIEKDLGLPRPEIRKKWDHNVITPATEFMDRMGLAVEWYILKKLNEDPAWRHLAVVYSDAHVPGEGEHKIMQFIRGLRSHPGYQPNASHVIHGMDADLICLGLSLHEEHVSILRNQLTETFQPDHSRFCYFNLHTYREALREDFANITDMDFERVLDDFVYLCFFVGNDFLPHIPLVSIKTQGIELLLDHYVRRFDEHGYLTRRGVVSFDHLALFLCSFVQTSMPKLRMAYHGVERAKRRATVNVEERLSKSLRTLQKLKRIALAKTAKDRNGDAGKEEEAEAEAEEEADLSEEDGGKDDSAESPLDKVVAAAKRMDRAELSNSIHAVLTDMRKEQDRFVADRQPLGFSYLSDDYREQYYKQKFGWDVEDAAAGGREAFERNVHQCCAEYFRGTQWVMLYYTKGCPSWEWYYPYHYAPLIQDLAAFQGTVDVDMRPSAPLHPFEQLVAVLPRQSVHGLPKIFHKPVLDSTSVLGPFYPNAIDFDFSEANFSYQGVLRLPFIDCKALHKAIGKIAVLEPDRPTTLVFCRDKSALGRQVGHLVRGPDGEEEDDGTLTEISKEIAERVPIAGRIGPPPKDRRWPLHATLDCPDTQLAAATEFGASIHNNRAYCFRYEMDSKAKYRPQLLGLGGKPRRHTATKKEEATTANTAAPTTAPPVMVEKDEGEEASSDAVAARRPAGLKRRRSRSGTAVPQQQHPEQPPAPTKPNGGPAKAAGAEPARKKRRSSEATQPSSLPRTLPPPPPPPPAAPRPARTKAKRGNGSADEQTATPAVHEPEPARRRRRRSGKA